MRNTVRTETRTERRLVARRVRDGWLLCWFRIELNLIMFDKTEFFMAGWAISSNDLSNKNYDLILLRWYCLFLNTLFKLPESILCNFSHDICCVFCLCFLLHIASLSYQVPTLLRLLSLLFYLTGSTLSVTSPATTSAKLDCLNYECLHVPFMAEIPCDFNSPDTAQPCSTV